MRPVQLLLALLAISTVVGFVGTQSTTGIYESTGLVRGWDFQQFYLAGTFVAQGQVSDLYNIEKFQAAQRALLPMDEQNIPFVPLYPPMIGILVAPLARLSYLAALLVWWGVGLVSYGVACWLLLKSIRRRYRSIAVLAMCGFFPFFIALRAGQLTPLLLLVAVVGLRYRNGLVLSLLLLKPQFACGMLLYFLVRRKWKLCGTMVLGCLAQLAMVSVILGPQVLVDYLSFARIYAHHSQMYSFPDGWVHSLSGITGAFAHIVIVALLAVYLGTVRKLPWAMECALATCFMLLATPHLLLYDLAFLAIPAALLLRYNWKLSVVLVAASSAVALPIYIATNVSIVPFLLFYLCVGLIWRRTWNQRAATISRKSPRTLQLKPE